MDVRYSQPVESLPKRSRGEYQPGRERRVLIMEQATELFSIQGFGATSFREIAAACNLTPAGLEHHFSDKTMILLELLRQREREGDELQNTLNWRVWLLEIERINRANPTASRLFTILSAEAIEPSHPAHEYFVDRYATTRAKFADLICKQRSGRVITNDDRRRAQILIGAWDGLQLQALLDPQFAMRPAFELAIRMVSPASATSSTSAQASPPKKPKSRLA